jgi:hypothetical protein
MRDHDRTKVPSPPQPDRWYRSTISDLIAETA